MIKKINKNNKYKKQYEKDQRTIKLVDKLCSKSLQDEIINKNEYDFLCKIFTKFLEEKKLFFINMNIKMKLNFF